MRSILILLDPSVYKLLLYALSISPCRFFKLTCSKCGVVVNVFVSAIMTVELARDRLGAGTDYVHSDGMQGISNLIYMVLNDCITALWWYNDIIYGRIG